MPKDKNQEILLVASRIDRMKMYLNLKVEEGDWHGVADAAMDLRDLENYLFGLKFDKENT